MSCGSSVINATSTTKQPMTYPVWSINGLRCLASTFSNARFNIISFFFFQAEDGIRDGHVTGVQTCALPILDVAEARAEAPPADPPRRREWPHAAAGRGLLRRLVPPRARGRRDLHGARGPQGARGPRGARHEDDLRLRLRRQARGGRARPARGGRRDARNSQVAVGAARPGAATPGSVRQARPVSLDLPAWAAELLRESRVARLGTADRAGRPLVVPVCYAFDGRACFSAIDAKPKRVAGRDLRRVRNIEQNPHVSLVVDRYDEDWSRLAWVIVEGRAALVTEGSVRALAVDLLRAKYAQYRTMGLDREGATVIRIAPERALAWRYAS